MFLSLSNIFVFFVYNIPSHPFSVTFLRPSKGKKKSAETRAKNSSLTYYPPVHFSPLSPHPSSRPSPFPSPSSHTVTPPSPFKPQTHFFTPADRKKKTGSDVGLDRDSGALFVAGRRGRKGGKRGLGGFKELNIARMVE